MISFNPYFFTAAFWIFICLVLILQSGMDLNFDQIIFKSIESHFKMWYIKNKLNK